MFFTKVRFSEPEYRSLLHTYMYSLNIPWRPTGRGCSLTSAET
jgi:hypothetical protein